MLTSRGWVRSVWWSEGSFHLADLLTSDVGCGWHGGARECVLPSMRHLARRAYVARPYERTYVRNNVLLLRPSVLVLRTYVRTTSFGRTTYRAPRNLLPPQCRGRRGGEEAGHHLKSPGCIAETEPGRVLLADSFPTSRVPLRQVYGWNSEFGPPRHCAEGSSLRHPFGKRLELTSRLVYKQKRQTAVGISADRL